MTIKVNPSNSFSSKDVATDDIGGTHYPVYKTAFGETGSVTRVSSVNPLPVDTQLSRTAFGELSVVNYTPVVQIHFPYNINTEIVEERSNNGSASISLNRLKLSTGAGANQSSQVLSRIPIKYNPGQGGLIRFTALFTTGVANSTQLVGVGDSGDGYFFGFNGAAFGVLRRQGGTPEVRKLTVTTKSTTAENITITLDSVAVTDVTVTDATSGDVTTTAADITAHDFSNVGRGWVSHHEGDEVYFTSYDASSKTGTYSLSSASTAAGTFAQALAGGAPTDTWTAQTAWNEDKMDGTGVSGMTLDITKGNVYQIQYQWLGFGQIRFYVEHDTDGEFELVHTIDYANANTIPSVDNPTLPLCLLVENISNTSDIVIHSSSLAGFVEGEQNGAHISKGASVEFSGIGTTETPLLTIHTKRIYQGKLNRVRLKIAFASISVDGTKPSTIRFKTNGVLTGASYSDVDTANSITEKDTSATAISGGEEQLAIGMSKSDSNIISPPFFFLNPGESLTVTGEASTSTIDGVVSFNWEEIF